MKERSRQDETAPVSADRRKILLGLGLAGGAAVSGLNPSIALGDAPTTDARPSDQGLERRQPFYGLHQSGVTTPRPPAGLVVAFDVLGATRGDLERLLRKLTERIEFLTQGGPAPEIDPKFPAPNSGSARPCRHSWQSDDDRRAWRLVVRQALRPRRRQADASGAHAAISQ